MTPAYHIIKDEGVALQGASGFHAHLLLPGNGTTVFYTYSNFILYNERFSSIASGLDK